MDHRRDKTAPQLYPAEMCRLQPAYLRRLLGLIRRALGSRGEVLLAVRLRLVAQESEHLSGVNKATHVPYCSGRCCPLPPACVSSCLWTGWLGRPPCTGEGWSQHRGAGNLEHIRHTAARLARSHAGRDRLRHPEGDMASQASIWPGQAAAASSLLLLSTVLLFLGVCTAYVLLDEGLKGMNC